MVLRLECEECAHFTLCAWIIIAQLGPISLEWPLMTHVIAPEQFIKPWLVA